MSGQRLKHDIEPIETYTNDDALSHSAYCQKHAKRIGETYGPIELSEADWLKFQASMDDPPEPNEKLKQLFVKHRDREQYADRHIRSIPLSKLSHEPLLDDDALSHSGYCQKHANRIGETYGPIELSEADWLKFQASMDDPPEPNEKLKQLFVKHRHRLQD